MRREGSSTRLAITLVISLGVHALALIGLQSMILRPIEPKEAPPVAMKPVPIMSESEWRQLKARSQKVAAPTPPPKAKKPEPPKPKPPETPDGQVVEIPPPPREERPENAKRVSDYDSKVEREQVSRLKKPPSQRVVKADRELISPGQDPDGTTRDAVRKKPKVKPRPDVRGPGEKKHASKKAGPDAPGQPTPRKVVERPQKPLPRGDGLFRHTPDKRPAPELAQGGGGEIGGAPTPDDYRALLPSLGLQDRARSDGSIDHIPDVDQGERTFLNTRDYKFAWFFNRVKRDVQKRWRAVDAHRRHDPYGRVFGVRDRLTVVDVTLNDDGSLDDIYVAKDSGVAFLDQVALQAFRDAQPFPNPPAALRGDDGRIRFRFAFFLEINNRGMRMFRY